MQPVKGKITNSVLLGFLITLVYLGLTFVFGAGPLFIFPTGDTIISFSPKYFNEGHPWILLVSSILFWTLFFAGLLFAYRIMPRPRMRLGIGLWAGAGAGVPIVLEVIAHYTKNGLPLWGYPFWPSAIFLMATDGHESDIIVTVPVFAISIIANVFVYVCVGAVLKGLWWLVKKMYSHFLAA